MASGKKGKKTKGKTFALNNFLQEIPGPVASVPIRKSASNWADEVEDSYDGYESRSKFTNIVLPTEPKASRDYDDISEKVPKDPPYIAYLSNLPYDVDEDEIAQFFGGMSISNMRIPKDDRPGEIPKLKGFGYVEFADRESLLDALALPDTTLKNRRIRIELATNLDNDKRRGRMDMNRDRSDRSEITSGDWRSGPRSENTDSDRRGYSKDNRDRDGGFNREPRETKEDDKPGAWRDGERSNNDRGYSRYSRDDRGSHYDSDRGNRFEDRRNYNDRGHDRDGDRRGYGERRGFNDRGFRKFDDDDRSSSSGFTRREPREDESSRSEPRQRRKLQLAPRTRPVETANTESVVPSASIFGNAKPVDTTQREKQIEERLAKEQEKPREVSKDRRAGPPSEDTDRRIERNRPTKRDDSPKFNRPSSQNRRSDDERQAPPKNDSHKTSDTNDRKVERPKREEKRDKPDRADREMPKFREPEVPNFAANNKFAYLAEDSN